MAALSIGRAVVQARRRDVTCCNSRRVRSRLWFSFFPFSVCSAPAGRGSLSIGPAGRLRTESLAVGWLSAAGACASACASGHHQRRKRALPLLIFHHLPTLCAATPGPPLQTRSRRTANVRSRRLEWSTAETPWSTLAISKERSLFRPHVGGARYCFCSAAAFGTFPRLRAEVGRGWFFSFFFFHRALFIAGLCSQPLRPPLVPRAPRSLGPKKKGVRAQRAGPTAGHSLYRSACPPARSKSGRPQVCR